MTMLFKRITSQMIDNCRETLKAKGRLWDQDTDQLVVSLKTCIKLKDEYIRCYRLEKEKLEQTPNGKQFNFNELQIFGKFELFCSRIESLVELFSTIDQFKVLQTVSALVSFTYCFKKLAQH